jgi:type I restriction enzyme S subunit
MSKKSKKTKMLSIEDYPYEVPRNWIWCSYDSVADVRDGTHDSPQYIDEGYPLITSKNLKNGGLTFEKIKYISEEDHKKISVRSKVDEGDILFAMIGTIGNPVLIERITDEFSIKNVALFKPNKELIRSKYLNYLLLEKSNMDRLLKKSKGSTQKFIALGKIRDHMIPVPPLPEQQRIVNRIESLFEKIDKAEALINEAREGFEKRKEAILAKAFRGELTEKWREEHNQVPLSEQQIDELKSKMTKKQKLLYESKDITDDVHELPKTWEWIRLGSVYNFVGGGTPSKAKEAYWNGSIPWTTVKDIKGDYLYDSQDSITQLGLDNSSANIANKGDVILITRMSPGKTIISNIDTAINQDLKIVKPIIDIPSLYSHYYFKSIISKCETMAKGTTVKGIRLEQINDLLFPLAPEREMKEISNILVEVLEEENKIDDLSDQMEELKVLKKAILAKAFRGELGTNNELEKIMFN